MSDSVIVTGIITGGLVTVALIITGGIFAFNVLNSLKRGWWK